MGTVGRGAAPVGDQGDRTLGQVEIAGLVHRVAAADDCGDLPSSGCGGQLGHPCQIRLARVVGDIPAVGDRMDEDALHLVRGCGGQQLAQVLDVGVDLPVRTQTDQMQRA